MRKSSRTAASVRQDGGVPAAAYAGIAGRIPGVIRGSSALLATVTAALLSICWLVLPHSGSDLAAQVAHADFFSAYGWFPIDMRWFGGTDVFGYSLIGPWLMSWLGVGAVGVLATIAGSALWGILLARCEVPHPRAGALLGAGCLVGNLAVGRLTFAIGVAAALATLLCLWLPRRWRLPLLVLGTVLTWAASPLAALFLAMVGTALVVRRRVADGVALTVTTGMLLLVMAAIGGGGIMPMSGSDLIRGLVACGMVAVVTRYPIVRVVAGLSALSLVLAFVIQTPVGGNAIRFPAIFAVPVALATSRFRWPLLLPALVLSLLIVPPLNASDVSMANQPADDVTYFAGLNHELASLQLTGRVEVVPTWNRWETAYVANTVPLARGWMTQVDRAHNELFFDNAVTSRTYLTWLRNNGVQYVALSDSPPSNQGVSERQLIETHPAYLRPVWNDAHWTLYAVRRATTTVSGAGLINQGSTSVSFAAAQPGTVLVRVRWSRWLTLQGPAGCLAPWRSWTSVVVRTPGVYRLSSQLVPGAAHATCSVP
ncbi:MAG: hypothetical protein ACR2KG_11945 [Nocardioidaceae bacterium]